jgi:hypothetical protein
MLRSFLDLKIPGWIGVLVSIPWGGMFAFISSRRWNKKVLISIPALVSAVNFLFYGLYCSRLRALRAVEHGAVKRIAIKRIAITLIFLIFFYVSGGLIMVMLSIPMFVSRYRLGNTLLYVSQRSKELNAFD